MRKFTTPPQVYAARPGSGFAGSIYTFPHDLGVQPYIVRAFYECIVPDLGYSVGAIVPIASHSADRVLVNPLPVPSYAATGFTMVATPTEVTMSYDTNNGASIHKYDRKRNGRLANNAWKIVLKVYAP